jgi:uncharacterized SAM-binding protein YcdF (DUF218 family)
VNEGLLQVHHLFDPVGIGFVLLAVGLALYRRRVAALPRSAGARRALRVAIAALVTAWLAATPLVVNVLLHLLEARPVDINKALEGRDPSRYAVVVLSAGRRTNDPREPAEERLDGASQARVLTAARIFSERPFALLIASGGPPPIVEGMHALLQDLGVPETSIVLDDTADSTRASGVSCSKLIQERKLEGVILVTSALHTARARRWFERYGINTIIAPADVQARRFHYYLTDLYPSAIALRKLALITHELIGDLSQALSF